MFGKLLITQASAFVVAVDLPAQLDFVLILVTAFAMLLRVMMIVKLLQGLV